MVEVFGENMQGLIGGSNLLQNLYECIISNDAHLRQTAFALCGDLARHCMPVLQVNVLEKFLPILCNNIYITDPNVCNNAVWAISEISMKIGKNIASLLPTIIPKILVVLENDSMDDYIYENLSSSIGRLGLVCPEVVATSMDKWLKLFCT